MEVTTGALNKRVFYGSDSKVRPAFVAYAAPETRDTAVIGLLDILILGRLSYMLHFLCKLRYILWCCDRSVAL